jgi:type II secretory pathway pseudopilin PulG
LVWLLAIVAALALVAGVALPSRVQQDDAACRRRTELALRTLGRAGSEYFRDTLQWPAALADLEVSNGVATWSGPYVELIATHAQVAQSTNRVDGWGRPIVATGAGGTWTLRSAGSNGSSGDADDIVLAIDAAPIRAELTRERMDVLNRSISEYNEANPPSNGGGSALPNDLSGLLAVLVAQSYLPTSAGYSLDAWGVAFSVVTDSSGNPTGITSVNCDAHPIY